MSMTSSAATVAPSTPLMELGDPTDLEVVVDVLTEDAVRIPPAAIVTLNNVLTIPSSAAFRQGDRWATFVAADGRASLRMIELGHRSASEIEIARGLGAGDVVIVHPSDSVRDGTRVASVPSP